MKYVHADRSRRRTFLKIAISLLCTLTVNAVANSSQSRPSEWAFNSTIPLGTDLLVLQPSKLHVALMASAESEEFKTWKLIEENEKRKILASDGQPIKKMPTRNAFRLTAGTKH